ncbi:MAG TPA: helix-turn-helix transcriptional regulator [Chthoniobacteraceae bacterium]|jgi:transcriptional regulator with XRE-family HTH domain|nr:helix-turn-helix transcriptional regulator [Chthoniobacteraceae bacterium]
MTPNERLRQVRSRRYATAKEAAEAIGVKVPTYSQHENDTRNLGGIPRKAAERYANFFKVSLDWLMAGVGAEPELPPEPTEEDLKAMLSIAIHEVPANATIGDWPRLAAPVLHGLLARFRAGEISRPSEGEKIAPDRAVQSRAATKPSARA